MPSNRYAGVDNLLTPENHTLLLIDRQALQLLTVGSHDPAKIVNSAAGLAKAAKVFKVPTLLTTAFASVGSGSCSG